MATIDLPDNIERQLLALDRQVRDATFARGISRLALIVTVLLGCCLLADWKMGLAGPVRLVLLIGWCALSVMAVWRQVLRPMWWPPSLSELAALVERQHPELKERLSSLVQLREQATPGASKLMRDLLARQTAKAVERLDLADAAPAIRSPGTAFAAVMACLLLLGPFAFAPADYGLLWARLFAPLGNFHWGSTELIVVGGDRVVARGSDVPIQIELRQHGRSAEPEQKIVWLHTVDAAGIRDSRRMEWDVEAGRYVTTVPHVSTNLTIHATVTGARSEQHRVDVADRPAIARLQMDIEPPAYTGLPARSVDGAQGEIRAPERSRIVMKLEFAEPVVSAELDWPIVPEASDDAAVDKPRTSKRVSIRVAEDKRTATVEAPAVHSGPFAIYLQNEARLSNEDPSRSLVVDPDLPPAISLGGTEEPVAVHPGDRHVIAAQVRDDFGLTAVELHLETSAGAKRVDPVPADALRDRSISYEFPVDVSDFDLKPGQAITYKLRAVDNRPVPSPQEAWTRPRTLMIDSRSSAPQDKDLAKKNLDAKEQIAELRKDLAQTKEALEKLHRKTEDESLQRKNSDKSTELKKLEQQQAELAERLQKLAAELAQKELTEKLTEQAQQLADRDLAEARKKLDQAREGEPRDQLQPLSEAIDRLAGVDKQLKNLDQQLNELNRLEQDLARLEQLARNSDRLAEKLEKLDQQSRDAAAEKPMDKKPKQTPDPAVAANDKPETGNPPVQSPSKPSEKSADGSPSAQEQEALEQQRQKLQAEGQKLADELSELLKKHPELLDAARRDQLNKLDQLAQEAGALAKPQEQLAKAFEQAAQNAPASAERPANKEMPGDPPKKDAPSEKDKTEGAAQKPAEPSEKNSDASKPGESSPQPKVDPNDKGSGQQKTQSAQDQSAEEGSRGAQAVKAQQQLAQDAARQALQLAQQQGTDSKATQAAIDFAKQAAAASRQAQTGNLEEAAKQGQAAATAAEQTAKEVSQAESPDSKQSQKANQLAEKQKQLAEQMQQAAGSKAAQQGAQQQGQQQLAEATATLSKRLDQVAKDLGSAPLDSKEAAGSAAKAEQAAKEAEQAMKQAANAAKSDDAQRAAEKSALAAQKLQEAAQQAENKPAPPKSGGAIPDELASNVAKAAQQLNEAQKELNATNMPGEKSGDKQSPSSDGPKQASESGEMKPGKSDSQPGTVSETGLAQAAEQFREAASALRHALNPQGKGDGQQQAKASRNSAATASAEPAEPGEPGQPGEPGPGGQVDPGAQAEADLKQLDADLKRQGGRNWGRLPGQLRTEILQGANKKPRPEYAKQIKSYFEEISKPATGNNSP